MNEQMNEPYVICITVSLQGAYYTVLKYHTTLNPVS